MAFNETIKKLRLDKVISLSDAARDLGVKPSTLHCWESGKRMPRPETLKKVAEYFNVTVDFLLK